MFDLPVDICGIDFAKNLYSEECLALNPVHSVPFMVVYKDGKKTGINGSEAITTFLVQKYRDKVPESFMPSDPLAQAEVNEKVAFILNPTYRATMYQYVYPMMGLMTECQYDICKRDFCLNQVEAWAKAKEGPYFFGAEPSLADLYWLNLWLGNNWVAADDFDLPWRHKDVIGKFPASKAIIDAMLEIPAIKTLNASACGEGDAPIDIINATGFFGLLAKKLPGNARKFDHPAGAAVHPNMVPYSDKKAEIDQPTTL
jgi:glutathione S-transferase